MTPRNAWLLALLGVASCGGAAATPTESSDAPPNGCWTLREPPPGSDAPIGAALCFEPGGYVMRLTDELWEEQTTDWSRTGPSAWEGHWGAQQFLLRIADGSLFVRDSRGEGRFEPASEAERTELASWRARLPSLRDVCRATIACLEAMRATDTFRDAPGFIELDGTSSLDCRNTLAGVLAVYEEASLDPPAACRTAAGAP